MMMNINHHNTTGTISDEIFIVAAHKAVTSLGWQILYMSDEGIVAGVEDGIQVRILKEENHINIGSLGGDNQTAQRNVENLNHSFEKALATLHPEMVEAQYIHLSQSFKNSQNVEPKQKKRLSNLLVPSKNFLFTPVIIYINVLIFIVMVIKGIDFFSPDPEMMIHWGANFKPETLNGEWWRLITACFLHFGILHLVLNMYALLYIGIMLEPLIGKWRFISAYFLTGIASSALSLYWNDPIVSAGASGAIFGMYGMFIAMLVGNVVHKSVQKDLLASMAGFVVINLGIGFTTSGIDNAAHIGGLISGMIIGFIMIPALKNPKHMSLNIVAYIGALLIGLGSGWFSYNYSTNINAQYQDLIEAFSKNEQACIPTLSHLQEYNEKTAEIITDSILPYWKKNQQINNQIKALKLPEYLKKHSVLLQEYTDLRIKSFDLVIKRSKDESSAYDNAIEKTNSEIQNILKQLNTSVENNNK
jgi:rhomboid protease GluP